MCTRMKEHFIKCPECGGKTRTKIYKDTMLKNFPLFCPKCKSEFLISLHKGLIQFHKMPDAKTQSTY